MKENKKSRWLDLTEEYIQQVSIQGICVPQWPQLCLQSKNTIPRSWAPKCGYQHHTAALDWLQCAAAGSKIRLMASLHCRHKDKTKTQDDHFQNKKDSRILQFVFYSVFHLVIYFQEDIRISNTDTWCPVKQLKLSQGGRRPCIPALAPATAARPAIDGRCKALRIHVTVKYRIHMSYHRNIMLNKCVIRHMRRV